MTKLSEARHGLFKGLFTLHCSVAGRYPYFQVGQKLGGGSGASVPVAAQPAAASVDGPIRRSKKWDDDEFHDAIG